MTISDWSSDVCSSDLVNVDVEPPPGPVTPCRSMLCGILLSGMLRRWNWIVSPWRTRMKLPGTVPPKVQKVYVVPSEIYISFRSTERRVGKGCVSTCKSRSGQDH